MIKHNTIFGWIAFTVVLAIVWVLTGCNESILTPSVGQWVTYGGSEPQVVNGSFDFHCCDASQVSGYYYTQLPAVPKVGQTLTLNYTVTGNNPVWQQAPASGGNSETDINPPTLHLFLWRKGDDLSCSATNVTYGPDGHTVASRNGGFADYRLFAGRTPLVLGANQTVSVTLDAAHWTNCWGSPPLAIGDELNNLIGAGVTFGGQWFAGHAIYLSSGDAKFTINSFGAN